MARIGQIEIGGREAGCGVAFDLMAPSPVSLCMNIPGGDWTVEVVAGQDTVVGRTARSGTREKILTEGLEWVERFLDLLAFRSHKSLVLKEPGDRHIIVFERDGAFLVQHVDASDLSITVRMTAVVKDESGAVVPPLPVPPPSWIPALRFYRLSQSNTNLHDAYRSLWLGLEALLASLSPVTTGERERDWLFRALNSIAATHDLRSFAPGRSDPVSFIMGTQYDHVRCRLFHAKPPPRGALVDHPSPEEVLSAYEALLRFWRFVATEVCKVPATGSGGTTYEGYRYMMDRALEGRTCMAFTSDVSPAQRDDVAVSPLGREVWTFDDVRYLSETAPGRVAFAGLVALKDVHRSEPVHRVCGVADGTLLTTTCINAGLDLNGADAFESRQTIRLINPDMPRVSFGAPS